MSIIPTNTFGVLKNVYISGSTPTLNSITNEFDVLRAVYEDGTNPALRIFMPNISSSTLSVSSITATNAIITNLSATTYVSGGTPLEDIIVSLSPPAIPGGSDTQVQYNSNGTFSGDSGLVYSNGNLTVSGEVQTKSVQFETTITGQTAQEGELNWNYDDGTLQVGMPGGNVTLQIGQEELLKVTNKTGADLYNGQIVSINGAQGQRPTISLCIGSAATCSPIAILTEDIDNNNSGYANMFGIVRDVNTASYTAGTQLYISSTIPGGYTNVVPNAPNSNITIGHVIHQGTTDGQILFNPSVSQKLVNLQDVNGTTTTTSGQIPVWNNTSQYFDFNYNINNYATLSGANFSGGITAPSFSSSTFTSTTANITSLTSSTEKIITTSGSSLLQNYLQTDAEFITNTTVIQNIINTSNWLYNSYTGTTSGLVEGQKYQCCNFFYVYSNATLYRYPNGNPALTVFNAYGSAATTSDIIIVSASTAFTLMMPPANSLILGECVVKNIGAGAVTLSATTSTFDGNTFLVVPQWGAPNLFSYLNNYLIY